MLNKKWLYHTSISLSLLLVACSKSQGPEAPPVVVETAPVEVQAWQDSVQATGTLKAIQGAEIRSEVAGRVTKIYFTSGQQVKAGDSLIDINPNVLAAQLKADQATAALQQANFKRAQQLYKQKFISKADYDQARANQDTAIATAKAAAASLAEAQIKAPFAGTVGINLINVGDYTAQGTPLLHLEQLDKLRVDFSVAEEYANQVAVGDKVELHLKNNGAQTFVGRVTGVDSAIDNDTRMLALQAVVPNTQAHTLLPGGFAQVKLYYGPSKQVLTVPQIAVAVDGDDHKVFKVVAGHAQSTPVTVGERFGDQVVIESGLQASDVIVTNGLVKVHDGAAVVNAATANNPTATTIPHGKAK